jgi:hypothetical protein
VLELVTAIDPEQAATLGLSNMEKSVLLEVLCFCLDADNTSSIYAKSKHRLLEAVQQRSADTGRTLKHLALKDDGAINWPQCGVWSVDTSTQPPTLKILGMQQTWPVPAEFKGTLVIEDNFTTSGAKLKSGSLVKTCISICTGDSPAETELLKTVPTSSPSAVSTPKKKQGTPKKKAAPSDTTSPPSTKKAKVASEAAASAHVKQEAVAAVQVVDGSVVSLPPPPPAGSGRSFQ